jgi:hypothetical protein
LSHIVNTLVAHAKFFLWVELDDGLS